MIVQIDPYTGLVPLQANGKPRKAALSGVAIEDDRSGGNALQGRHHRWGIESAESRIIADLLLRKVDAEGWKDAIVKQNVLQARSPATATRLTKLDPGAAGDDGAGPVASWSVTAKAAWRPMRSSPPPSSTARCSATSSIWSCGEQYRLFAERCRTSCGTTTSTAAGSVTPTCRSGTNRPASGCVPRCSRSLAQAGYIENTRSLKLQTVHIADQVLHYLKAHDEEYVLRCIQVAP